jgi:SnoaL-like protein
MGNDVAAFKSWLDAYGHAWENRNPEAATALFAENGTYQVTPFLEPMRGRKAIFEYWSEVARTEENTRFGHEILVVNAGLNIARWSASFVRVPQGSKLNLMESS